MRQFILLLAFLLSHTGAIGQTKVFTEDITNFFAAFDQVAKYTSPAEQLNAIQTLYVDKASSGLKDFMALGGGNPQKWLNYIRFNKEYLVEMRPYLEAVSAQTPIIQDKFEQIKRIYPNFKDGNIYFIIGCGFVGGTPMKQTNNLLLGAEVLVQKKNVDWAIPSAIHEFMHLQQKDGNGQLLTQTVNEGVAEFLSEVFWGKDLAANGHAPHLQYGNKNQDKIWKKFRSEMFVINKGFLGWLYGSKSVAGKEIQDLGYFIGYKICKSFYEKTEDKALAIKTLLELDLSSDERIRAFVLQSGFLKSKDVEFVKTYNFTDKHAAPNHKKVQYGYTLKGDKVIFEYSVPAAFLNRYRVNIGVVSVAGSFNNWDPTQAAFKMTQTSNHTFRLILPKSVLNLPAEQQFKFVINEDIWMPAPETAQNVDEKSQNLTLSGKNNDKR